MTCVGIDLGTTNSLVAVFDESGPRLIPNSLGEFLTPSVVGLADDRRTVIVGRAAKARLLRHPDLTAARFKRLMGTGKKLKLGRSEYSPVDLSALVLKSLKSDAERHLGAEVTEAVISVPAYFNGIQRQATKDAAEIAGLKVRSLINEPTAAALAAGVQDREGESTFIVLDLGGGTFDVSILEMFDGVMEVRASSGDAILGGEDFTARIARQIAEQNDMAWAKLDAVAQEALLSVADDFKLRLSSSDTATGKIRIAGRELEVTLTTQQFEKMTEDLVAKMRRPIESSLYDSGVSADRIDRVLLVGGATRMPVIRSLAARVFRKLPDRGVDPDQAVALGAAVQAGLIQRHEGLRDMVMTDVAPFSLGIVASTVLGNHVVHDRFAPIIERNTILPASRSAWFETSQDNQVQIAVVIYQGEAAMASDNVKLGELQVPVPRGPKGKEAIECRFTYDTSGLLAVDVTVLSNKKTYSDVIENLAEALSSSEKTRRLKEMEKLKISPHEQAENIVLVERLKRLYEILLGEDRIEIQTLLAEFEMAMDGQDPGFISSENERLSKVVTAIEDSYVR
ncbi:Hsp70 family protein [Paracoccus caeni]|uniref:Hsp70 family protein n=1 Tax=Paracoccus caeni TaxID=657651 RepID=A0A934W113_9RHOB|nr:Hsp70 family protein [Paracoccus caeni]MBK4217500.1 Hsp70 family protein [Paracoccus caeni]